MQPAAAAYSPHQWLRKAASAPMSASARLAPGFSRSPAFSLLRRELCHLLPRGAQSGTPLAPPSRPLPRPIVTATVSSSSSSAPPSTSKTKVPALSQGEELAEWVKASGGEVRGVRVANAGVSGWCLAASETLKPGTVLIQLPEGCQLTYDVASDPNVLKLVERVPAELWGAKLALQVLAHRAQGGGSRFAAYVGLLPKAVEGLPMFFSGEAIKELQYPTLIAQVTKRCKFLLEFADGEIAKVTGTPDDPFGGQKVDANALGWALAVVTSRAFRTRGPGHPASMLPLIDMCNHSFEPNCEVRPAGGGKVEMVTKQQVAAGEELFLSYGALGNDFLLLDYGFIVENNPHDTCQLAFDMGLLEAGRIAGAQLGGGDGSEVGLGDDESPKPWQQKLLSDLGLLGGKNSMVFIGGPKTQPVDRLLLAAARVMSASGPEDLPKGSSAAEALGSWGRPLLDPAKEAASVKMLVGVCALMLGRFPTAARDDMALLQAGGMEADTKLAVQYRLEVKKALLRAIGKLTERLKGSSPAARDGRPAAARSPTKKVKKTAADRAKAKRGRKSK